MILREVNLPLPGDHLFLSFSPINSFINTINQLLPISD